MGGGAKVNQKGTADARTALLGWLGLMLLSKHRFDYNRLQFSVGRTYLVTAKSV